MNDLYNDLLNASIRKIIESSKSIEKIQHNGIKGGLRESFLSNLIKPYLNPNLDICSGKIIDSFNNQSNQIDCIIYDPTIIPPALIIKSDGIIPYESVLATIEVKRTVTSSEIKKIIKNAISIKKLKPNWTSEIGGLPGSRFTPLCCSFSFKSDIKGKSEYERYFKIFEEMKQLNQNEKNFFYQLVCFVL